MSKIILFGDSITGGYLNRENTDILEELTSKHLSNMGFPGYTFINKGINGETSRNGLARVGEVIQEDAEIVVVFFGDNDAVDQRISVPEYQKNLSAIIERIGSEKVLLVSPSYIRIMDQKILEEYVAAAQEAAGNMVHFLNLYQHMVAYPGRNDFLQYDGLHLSEDGYDFLSALIARDIKFKLMKELKKQQPTKAGKKDDKSLLFRKSRFCT